MTIHIPAGMFEVSMVLRHELDPDPWTITFGFSPMADPGGAPFTDRLHGVVEAFTNNMRSTLSTAVTIVEATGRFGTVESETGPWPMLTETINLAGTATGAVLPQNCALMVKKNTATPGRRGRGRFFLPGSLPEAEVNAVGTLNSTLVTFYQDKLDSFMDDLHTAGPDSALALDMMVFHNVAEEVEAASKVLTLSVDPTVSTQRRRLR